MVAKKLSATALNVGGGFHHAFRDRGEGFCLYADVAIALAAERARRTLANTAPILVIDLDAHRGNGVWDILGGERAVHVFDLYNSQVYQGLFKARDNIGTWWVGRIGSTTAIGR